MDTQILIQYVIVLLSLILLEGLLSADNAIVLAVIGRTFSVVNPKATNPAALFTGPPKSKAVVAESTRA